MSLFDSFSKAVSAVTGGNLGGMASLVTPVELTNLEQAQALITEKITAAETEVPAPSELTHLRTFLTAQYGHLLDGGEPAPDALLAARIKADPRFGQLCTQYALLQQRLALLEQQHLQCTFGYQMADGSIVVPDVQWSREELERVRAGAVQQTARCWMNADRSQFVS
jgi:hypothetical protein